MQPMWDGVGEPGGSKNTFNVDDVGYANASDVNMSVGALNSSVYNTSRVWSDGIANSDSDFDQAKTNAFNGDRSNKLRTGGNSVLVTLNFSPALTVASTIEILGEDYSSADHRYTVTVDGTTTTKDVNQGQPATFNVSGSLTQITVDNNSGSGRTYLEWIRVDGKELIDSDITPPNIPSIASSGCSVGTKQGFSIIKFDSGSSGNKTLSHGLSETPTFIMVKTTGATSDWSVYHKDLGGNANNYLVLNSTAANASSSNIWGDSHLLQTSRIFGIKSGTTCAASQDVIAYCWHDVPGLQKFGSYEANGAANGSFVELGFRPALVWIKSESFTNSYTNWDINDSVRDTYNPADATLAANLVDAENSGNIGTQKIDFLSNGFKIRQEPTSSSKNTDGETYIYCAWAEAPSVDLYGGGANAR